MLTLRRGLFLFVFRVSRTLFAISYSSTLSFSKTLLLELEQTIQLAMKVLTKSKALLLVAILMVTGCSEVDSPDPVAAFTYSLIGNYAPCKVEFINKSVNSVKSKWDFGDNNISTDENPTHLFMSGGTYPVKLTAKNKDGTTDIYELSIQIENVPTKIIIIEFTLKKFPLTDGVASWDVNDAADVYFQLFDDQLSLVTETGYYENLDQSSLPQSFTSGLPVTLTDLNVTYVIQLMDYDLLNEDDWIGGYYFTPNYYIPTVGDPYPLVVLFGSTSTDIQFDLTVDWE